ncbi:MAG: hypothetical protein AB7I79_07045 [Rhizobiaceae bacterium]
MTQIEEITPSSKPRLMDLVRDVGIDVSKWGYFKGGPAKAAANPRYCYEWFFEDGDKVAVTLWLGGMQERAGRLFYLLNQRETAESEMGPRKYRARDMDRALQRAFEKTLEIRAIISDGEVKSATRTRSSVTARMLDPVSWAVTSYNFETGAVTLERGVAPTGPINTNLEDPEYLGFEGKERKLFVIHRQREWKLRQQKINQSKESNDGRLICEVPGCRFDFFETYGSIGKDYAQVHHLDRLSDAPPEGTTVPLSRLAIVCANCHAMIHRGGECRPLEGLVG